MLKVQYSGEYYANRNQLVTDNPEIKSLISHSVSWFCKNPDDTRLRNHALRKRLEGKWAFSVTDDIRIVYERKSKKLVRFLAIGGHGKVYRKK